MAATTRQRSRLAAPPALLLGAALVAAVASHAPARAWQQQEPARPASAAEGETPSGANTARGLELFRRGDLKGATDELRAAVKRNKADADAWHLLGLAHTRAYDFKEARKAFEQAVRLRPEKVSSRVSLAYALLLLNKLGDAEREAGRALALDPQHREGHYVLGMVRLRRGDYANALERAGFALRADPSYPPALLMRTQALAGFYTESVKDDDEPSERHRQWLRDAAETLEKYLRLNPRADDAERWREQLEALRVYANDADPSDPSRRIFRGNEVTGRAVLLSKPEPFYPERARRNNTTGTVRLRVVLGADGQVRHVLVVKGLPDGLTESAVGAARRIKFRPATRDGEPVSYAVMIEYNFNIY